LFDKVFSKEIVGVWDIQWLYACLAVKGLCILPSVNLVANIGFGKEATHTKNDDGVYVRPAQAMAFPLMHPQRIVRDPRADRYTFETLFQKPFLRRARDKFFSLVRRVS
jgi:hypothetical protein